MKWNIYSWSEFHLDSNSSRMKIHYSASEISSGSLDIHSKRSDPSPYMYMDNLQVEDKQIEEGKTFESPPPPIQTKMWSENRNEVLQARHVLVIVWEGEASQSNVIYCR